MYARPSWTRTSSKGSSTPGGATSGRGSESPSSPSRSSMRPIARSLPLLLIGELLLDRRGVEPRALARDEPVGEVEDVEDARAHRPPAAVEPERVAVGEPVKDRLVDDVALAVPAPDGLEAVDAQVREQPRVEPGDLLAAVQ